MLTDEQQAFLEKARGAAMITLRRDGTPHAVRVGIALIDGKIWSSGLPGRLRTRFVRRDPRCTVFVWEQGYGFLTVEGKVTVLEGPDAPDQSIRQMVLFSLHLSWLTRMTVPLVIMGHLQMALVESFGSTSHLAP